MATKVTIRKTARDKIYTRRYGIKLNTHTDAEIIDQLNKQSSIQGYIKKLIRADIAAHGGEMEESK